MYICIQSFSMIAKILPPPSTFSGKSPIYSFDGQSFDPESFDIAIMGFNSELSNAFRKQFYSLEFESLNHLEIIDLGDTFAMNYDDFASFVIELINKEVFPILIGYPEEFMISLSQKFEQEIKPHSICWVSSQTNPYIAGELDNNVFVKNQYYIGLQRHLSQLPSNRNTGSDSNRLLLSEFRKQNQTTESLTRNTDIFYFNLDSIRNSDFPGSGNPSGFFAEEIISISKLSGSSDRSLLSIISEWENTTAYSKVNDALVAQMVWYTLEGFGLKLKDKINKLKNLTHYVVEVRNTDIHLDFYKSEVSGKWWIQEPAMDLKDHHKLIPCTYEEYLKTVQEQLPDRLIELIYH